MKLGHQHKDLNRQVDLRIYALQHTYSYKGWRLGILSTDPATHRMLWPGPALPAAGQFKISSL